MIMDDIHFHEISIKGFRGRNFTLKMNPRGRHTVFVMDNNIGKTTTIELLRWCFKHKQSEAAGNFEHMWIFPAHILDHNIEGLQSCNINILISSFDEEGNEHYYRFNREVVGEFINGYGKTGDKINSVEDTLDIDSGFNIQKDDAANYELNKLFRLNDCADYFCFDGEKARGIMQLTSNSEKIELLLELINTRITNIQINRLKDKLNTLRSRVYSEAKSRVTDLAIQRNINDLEYCRSEQRRYLREISDIRGDIKAFDFNIKRIQDEHDKLEEEINASKRENLIKRLNLENDMKTINDKINDKRGEIYYHSLNWVQINEDMKNVINNIKENIRETGKLPEPYREALIDMCIKSNICQICGRELTKESKERVLQLGKQIAPTDVHAFLSSNFETNVIKTNPHDIQLLINAFFDGKKKIDNQIQSVELTTEDKQKIDNKDALLVQISNLNTNKTKLLEKIAIKNDELKEIENQVDRLEKKVDLLKENKIILDKINDSLKIIDDAEEDIKNRVVEIISQVISEGVSSILGPKFSARLSINDGLMLGEDGFYGIDRGGYGGRLILSYCFAEAMTLIDPIIVDTPSGNIGSHRQALAEHLCKNHKQVILLCLPTEIENFAPIVSPNYIEITNLDVTSK